MRDCGWTIEGTQLPKEVWICHEGRFEFDNEEDYNAYMDQNLLSNLQRAQDEEDEWLREEYYRRRRDPYRRTIWTTIEQIFRFLGEDALSCILRMGEESFSCNILGTVLFP